MIVNSNSIQAWNLEQNMMSVLVTIDNGYIEFGCIFNMLVIITIIINARLNVSRLFMAIVTCALSNYE